MRVRALVPFVLFSLWGTPSALSAIVYVNKNATGSVHDGKSWDTAFTTVQAGVNTAAGGDEVWVAVATYQEAIALSPGVKLYGGFAGSETASTQRNAAVNVTVLGTRDSGRWIPDSVVSFPAGCGRDTVVSGFTISRGSGKSSGNRFNGGGIHCDNASPTIEHNQITDNFTWNQILGGVWIGGGNGGGIACYNGAAPLIVGNLIAGNWVQNAVFGGGDGGLGAGIYCDNSSPTLINNTIVSNLASGPGGGIYGVGTSAPTLVNNIVARNGGGIILTAAVLRDNAVFSNGSDYSGVPDPTGTNGNIKADPLFSSASTGDYRVLPGSPCINTGDDSVIAPGAVDLDGKPRILGAHVDMGAYEFGGISLTLADVRSALSITAGMSAAAQDYNLLNVDGDGVVSLRDAVRIAQKVAGLN